MRLLRRISSWGLCPQTPRIYRFFLARMEIFDFVPGDRLNLSPAFPAAEPVARVASQHGPIPSDSGMVSINHSGSLLNEKAANGDNPLNFVSHSKGSPQIDSKESDPPFPFPQGESRGGDGSPHAAARSAPAKTAGTAHAAAPPARGLRPLARSPIDLSRCIVSNWSASRERSRAERNLGWPPRRP
jgi:hypothetical protein